MVVGRVPAAPPETTGQSAQHVEGFAKLPGGGYGRPLPAIRGSPPPPSGNVSKLLIALPLVARKPAGVGQGRVVPLKGPAVAVDGTVLEAGDCLPCPTGPRAGHLGVIFATAGGPVKAPPPEPRRGRKGAWDNRRLSRPSGNDCEGVQDGIRVSRRPSNPEEGTNGSHQVGEPQPFVGHNSVNALRNLTLIHVGASTDVDG